MSNLKTGFFSERKVIRVKKQDAAFVYFILESQEGLTSYSTLPQASVHDLDRLLELRISPDFLGEMQEVLLDLSPWVEVVRQPKAAFFGEIPDLAAGKQAKE